MANANHAIPRVAATTRQEDSVPAFEASTLIFENLMQAQRVQLEALNSWQQSMAAFTQEVWDEWVCHWGGGVPIDG